MAENPVKVYPLSSHLKLGKQILFHTYLCLNVCVGQVAHFYNTIDQQMIPSQKPMMLESAKAFERLAKNPKTGKSVFL